MTRAQFEMPKKEIEHFCKSNHIRRLSVFGSVLTKDFAQTSDIDLLVEFKKDHVPGLLAMARMERELSLIFGGRKIDLRTPEDLSKYFRKDVINNAKVAYAQ